MIIIKSTTQEYVVIASLKLPRKNNGYTHQSTNFYINHSRVRVGFPDWKGC